VVGHSREVAFGERPGAECPAIIRAVVLDDARQREFLAGVAGMSYRRFLSYNVIGGVAWILSLVYAGYLFGNIPWVKSNLTFIVIGIVIVSLIPAIHTFLQERSRHQK
jgi:membrane-associated protein